MSFTQHSWKAYVMKNNNKCKPMKLFTSEKSYIIDDQTTVWCPKSKLNPKHVCKAKMKRR